MAMKTRSPWWLTAIFATGLVALFGGERAFGHIEAARWILTGLGAILVGSSTALRAWAFARAEGRQRKVELVSLLCHAGVLVALGGYALTTDAGIARLGLEEEPAASFRTAATVLWVIVLAVSLLPLLMIELALGTAGRTGFAFEEDVADASVDLFRVREVASSGLTIALAAAFLMVTCNIADQRNVRRDVSYFKTSSAGTATINMVSSLSEPLTVLLFFPEVSEVAEEVEGYFESLASATGKVQVRRVDRLVDGELAKQHRVTKDGTIVLLRGEPTEEAEGPEADEAAVPPKPESQKITVDTDIEKARRTQLREFDGSVQKALMEVIRDKKVAYFSVGHGELNSPDSRAPIDMVNPLAKSTALKNKLRALNYRIADWDGFGKPIPDDADVLIVLGPRTPLLEEDLRAIGEYLDRGGSLLLALDPDSEATLGELSKRLGVTLDPTPLADDREHFPRTRTVADHSFLLTNQFSSHASITTVSRGQARSGMLFVRAASLEETAFEDTGGPPPKRTFVIRSMPSTFRDLDGDFELDKDTEQRSRYQIAAAIESAETDTESAEGDGGTPMRAFVIADREIFSDAMLDPLRGIAIADALAGDVIKWLGGEEEFAGETQDEKDVLIEHTKSEDAVWFYSTVVGAPLLVLGAGLALVYLRRRRTSRRTS